MDTFIQNPPRPFNSQGLLKQITVLVFALMFLQSCLETKSTEAQKIAPAPTSNIVAMTIGGDIPTDPVPDLDCVFNGTNVINGDSVTAYLNSSVGYGQSCVSETRLCRDAVLSGSYNYATCAVAAPQACIFDGQTVAHGDSVTAYTSSTVAFGSSCTDVAQVRTCNDGALSGNAQYALCRVDEPRSCLFDGRTIMHGETVQAFSTSTTEFGGQCTSEARQCNDGTLSGSFSYSSCVVDQPASCLFDGRTIAHGASVVAYASSGVAFGQSCSAEMRVCSNGQLSGSYTNGSCVVGEPANCQFNGNTVAHGESVIAYNVAQATVDVSCQSEVRSCQNGALSGSFMETSCVTPPPVEPPTDPVPPTNPPTDPNPPTNPPTDPVPPTNPPVDPPTQPPVDPVPEKGCLINGKEIPSGSSITLFMDSQVTAPAVCVSEVRVCKNGELSGSAMAATCVQITPPVEPPTIPPTVPPTDPVPPTTPPGQCSLEGMIWEFPNECSSCGQSIGFQKSRISRDGGKTWLTIKTNKLPDDLNAVWNYMMKKYGQNRCGRPNVKYAVSSRSKSLLVMDPSSIPGCDICKFREYTEEVSQGNMCAYKKKRMTQIVIKYTCENPKPQPIPSPAPPKCDHKCCDHKECDKNKHCDRNHCEHKHCDKKDCDHKQCDHKNSCDYKPEHKSCNHKECDKKKGCTKGHQGNGEERGHDHHDDESWISSWHW